MTKIREIVGLLHEAKHKVRSGAATNDEVIELLIALIDQLILYVGEISDENQQLRSELKTHQEGRLH